MVCWANMSLFYSFIDISQEIETYTLAKEAPTL